jgi:hypothetical protein
MVVRMGIIGNAGVVLLTFMAANVYNKARPVATNVRL